MKNDEAFSSASPASMSFRSEQSESASPNERDQDASPIRQGRNFDEEEEKEMPVKNVPKSKKKLRKRNVKSDRNLDVI